MDELDRIRICIHTYMLYILAVVIMMAMSRAAISV
jgi:hypothetical protein